MERHDTPEEDRESHVVVRFHMSGSSFTYDPGGKAARILREIAESVMSLKRGQKLERTIHDAEGDPIGVVRVRIPDHMPRD